MEHFSYEFVCMCDGVLKALSAVTGLWLMGLMVLRTNARGRWRVVGLELGPVFDPKMTQTGHKVALAFVVTVGLVMLRTFVSVV